MAVAVMLMAASCNKQDEIKVQELQEELDNLHKDAEAIDVPPAHEIDVPDDGAFVFIFDKVRYGVDAAGSVTVKYSLSAPATVEVTTKDGWSATVSASGQKEGEIVVTAPDPASPCDIVVTATAQDGRSTAATLPVMVRDPYTDATRTDVAAMGYYCLNRQLATDYHFQMMAECGMNMLTIESVDNWEEQLDLAHKYGMKGVLFVNGPAGDYYRNPSDTKLTRIIEVAKNHPALAGYQIYDEPHLDALNQMKIEKNRIEELDPNPAHPVYINLHPASASSYSLGTEDFFEYVETIATECNLKLITFDQYPIYTKGIDPSWPRSLAAVSQIAKRHGIPFWAFTLCCREDQRVDPSVENIRLQCNTNLAYGAQVNQFFVYRSTSGTDMAPLQTWEWKDGIPGGDKVEVVKYTPFYDYCKTYCHEMHNRGYVFADCNITKIRKCHRTDAWIESICPNDLPGQIENLFTSDDSIISFVENGGNEYIAVVNSRYDASQEVTVVVSDMVYMIDHDGVFTELQPGEYRLPLEAGDMLVFKY